MFWLHIIHYAGFLFAQTTNSILIYLILTKADKLFGSYRILMFTFALYSLIYAWIEVATQPIFHIKGPVIMAAVDSPLKDETWLVKDLPSLYAGSFALCVSILAAQFVYRYVVLYRPRTLSTIEKYKLLPLFIPCILCFIVYFLSVYLGMAKTIETQEYLREEILNCYGEDTRDLSFIAMMYWTIGENGEKLWRMSAFIAAAGCCSVITVCSSTIAYCAYNIYQSMKTIQSFMSSKSLELNKQLFITLTFQTLLPFSMMYIPVGLTIVLPLLEVHAGKLTNIVGASLAIYPALEPIVAMFCIREFRRTLLCNNTKMAQAVSVP
ncbi:unnamed protein product [Caenorhabditis brenneri]